MKNQDKILITGTGRSGTTILVKLISLLGLDTGYQNMSDSEIEQYINQNSRGGLEQYLQDDGVYPLICKAPQFYNRIPGLSKRFNILQVYVPMRDLEITARSRAKHGNSPGGLWEANDVKEQMYHNAKVIYQLSIDCARNNVLIKFIDFDKMVDDVNYAYDIYNHIWVTAWDSNSAKNAKKHNINEFTVIYNKVIDKNKITTK